MSTFVLPLSDPGTVLETVGGKGMSLARMAQMGLPVPGGFHITTAAYREFVAASALQPHILKALAAADPAVPASLETASQAIARRFASAAIPAEIERAILSAHKNLGAGASVAVRSSATAEDLPGASFAGQQGTYLNIRGAEAVLEAVKKCWASLWTARAIAYRIKNAIDQNTVALAVVVQEMVDAESAGILFTANPLSGRRDEMVINAAWGLGEAVVGGSVTPDTIIVDKATGNIKTMEIADKTTITVMAESGTAQKSLDGARRKSPVLKQAQVTQLARIALKIEEDYSVPQDIEWCYAGGKFYIVQSRPITALPEPPLEWRPSQPHTIAARMSFVEFMPDAVPPLFATLAVPIASQATFQLLSAIGLRENTCYYFEVINGYVYGCLDTRCAFKLGVQGTLVTARILRYGNARREEVQVNSHAAANRWRQADLATLPAAALLAGVRELFGVTADYFTVAQSGPIPSSTWTENIFRSFYNTLVRRKDDPPASAFLVGLENEPLRAEISLFDLAQWAREQIVLADYLQQTPAQAVWEALQADPIPVPLAGEFAARFAAHLDAFGHAIYDLDFSKPVAADNPLPLLETLKVYLAGQGQNPHARLQAQAELRRQAEQVIARRLDPLRRKWFQKLLKSAQRSAPDRENAIADLGLTYPQIRRLLRELGLRLVAGGAIEQPADIYWLKAGEVDALATALDKSGPRNGYSSSVEIRKAAWRRACRVTPPAALATEKWLAKMMAPRERKTNTLKGYGASAGTVTAPACVLRGPEHFGQMRPGDVLVAVTTTPAWTPLFAMASAVVTDIGGPLSHSSIVAREYGIPAVMATRNATRRIHTGQVITVDGSAGTITLKE